MDRDNLDILESVKAFRSPFSTTLKFGAQWHKRVTVNATGFDRLKEMKYLIFKFLISSVEAKAWR